jgi:hypothetical protein
LNPRRRPSARPPQTVEQGRTTAQSSIVNLDRLSLHIAKVTFSNRPANQFVPETVSLRHDIVVELSEDDHVLGFKSCSALSRQKAFLGHVKIFLSDGDSRVPDQDSIKSFVA